MSRGVQMIFNDRVKILRDERGVTQESTARAIGMPPRTYQRLEMDGCKTHYDTLMKIADYYDVSVDWLMGRTDRREVNR
jgi:transcriptional regulator with XRE-family HTH domain